MYLSDRPTCPSAIQLTEDDDDSYCSAMDEVPLVVDGYSKRIDLWRNSLPNFIFIAIVRWKVLRERERERETERQTDRQTDRQSDSWRRKGGWEPPCNHRLAPWKTTGWRHASL